MAKRFHSGGARIPSLFSVTPPGLVSAQTFAVPVCSATLTGRFSAKGALLNGDIIRHIK